jgi:hypothetical protein
MWSLDHLARSLFRSRSAGRLTRLLFFWVRFADRVTDPHYAADAASAVFFLGRRADGQLRPRDMVDDYTGGQR